ncbi:DUF927 domain-containing protein [Maridesulfovibrio bastinii]|uniref:DUF927 domain-containing protein n=1 Tax=Maridesulfovibrio bastinii TaxID=47157 RepID=UPI0003F7D52C|nr:DUF927 domain-containing protein [Maridesulfovibrio bastinii]
MPYRYALFPSGEIRGFEETEAKQLEMIRRGATAFSGHSFSEPLRNGLMPKRIWGDLYLFMESDDPLNTPMMIELFRRYFIVPANYKVCPWKDGLSILAIKEKAFRGDIGSPARFEFEDEIERQFDCHTPTISLKDVESHSLKFIPTDVWSCMVNKGASLVDLPVTLLAREYLDKHAGFPGSKDYFRPKEWLFTRCGYVRRLMKPNSSREEWKNVLAALVDGSNGLKEHDYVLSVLGMNHLIGEISYGEINSERISRRRKFNCHDIDFLRGYCKRDCGVTTPYALPYLSFVAEDPECFVGNIDGGANNSKGFYLKYGNIKRAEKRIMDPIWVRSHYDGGVQIACYDKYGRYVDLKVSYVDIDSPKFFSLLLSRQVHVPQGKAERGVLRKYLLSQLPSRKEKIVYSISDYAGWQTDAEGVEQYVLPVDSMQGQVQKIKAKSQVLPTSQDLYNSPRIGRERFVPEAVLAALFSLAAPLLSKIGMEGVCLHFHGGTPENRKLIIHAVQTVWGERLFPVHYSLADAQEHIVAVKMHRNDSVLCVPEVQEHQVSGMRKFLRRYFLGWGESDPGINGVVISTGPAALGEEKERSKGRAGYMNKGRVLAIDIELGEWSGMGVELTEADGELLLSKLVDGSYKLLLREFKVDSIREELKRKHVSAVYGVLITVFEVVLRIAGCLPKEGRTLLASCDEELGSLLARHNFERIFFGRIAIKLNQLIKDAQENSESCAEYVIPCGRGCFAVTAARFDKLIPKDVSKAIFTAWLKNKKVLRASKGKVCREKHFPASSKTLRAYFVYFKSLQNLVGEDNTSQKSEAKQPSLEDLRNASFREKLEYLSR